ncbi:hypothetical protein HMPREF0556_12063 [Listeria grayi DSM 20601]|uniref:Uncharacterized protein n=1 Tax=Listeria grayi DSM 20601 TaxID=525367 RepID=D7UYG1_LISGR|nr:hypothetical protein HMPREF0556_12063 [Listeria grayi DSM 20601]
MDELKKESFPYTSCHLLFFAVYFICTNPIDLVGIIDEGEFK